LIFQTVSFLHALPIKHHEFFFYNTHSTFPVCLIPLWWAVQFMMLLTTQFCVSVFLFNYFSFWYNSVIKNVITSQLSNTVVIPHKLSLLVWVPLTRQREPHFVCCNITLPALCFRLLVVFRSHCSWWY
jgi:hypothetical protein